MTMDIALGPSPAAPARGGERGGRMDKGEAPAFDEALTQKPARRMPHPGDAEPADGQPPKWRLGGYGDRLALLMPFAPAPDPAAGDPADVALPDHDGELPDTAAHEALPDAAPHEATPDATVRVQADDEPATMAAASAARQDGPRPAGRDAAAPAAGTADADGEAAPRRQAQAGIAATAAANERAQATAPAAAGAAAGEAVPADRRTAPPRMAAARPMAERGATDGRAPAGADAGQPRVNVLGFSTSAPPVLPATLAQPAALSPTAAGVVAAMEAEPAWRAAATEAASQRGQHSGTVSTLRIQLNPAELGLVTARLVATGSQLEIEIRVESSDARQRLSNDADTIVKALRGIGYDIERVTIQQAQPGAAAAQHQGGGQRDPFMQGQQDRAGANAGRGGQDGNGDADTARGTQGETAAERAGGGVYI